MTETLTTEQVGAIVAFAAEIEWLGPRVAAGVSALATELLAFRKADVFWDTVSAGPETGPPMQMVDFRRWAAVASKRITAANERADKADAELLALRKMVGELEGALKAVLNMVDGDGTPPDWDMLRDAALPTPKEPS